jgi:hypothetical protein
MSGKLKTSDPAKLSISVVVDGEKHSVGWGTRFFPTVPGPHSVSVYWVPRSAKRRATVDVAVIEDETVRVRYDAPRFTWQPGTLTVE